MSRSLVWISTQRGPLAQIIDSDMIAFEHAKILQTYPLNDNETRVIDDLKVEYPLTVRHEE